MTADLIDFLGLFLVTCQTRQLLGSDRKNSVAPSSNLNISNDHPLVPRCRVILEHLPGKRSLLVIRNAKDHLRSNTIPAEAANNPNSPCNY